MKKVLSKPLAIAGLIFLAGAGLITAADFDGDSRDDIATSGRRPGCGRSGG